MIHWMWLLDFPDRELTPGEESTDFKRMYEKVGRRGSLSFKTTRFNPDPEDKYTSPLGMVMQKS